MTEKINQAGWLSRAGALHDQLLGIFAHFDGLASLLLRLILGPVLIAAGWEKLTGDNWFGYQLESFPFPFNVLPAELSWFLASWTEFLGGILLLLGLGTRLIAIPLAVTMFVAAWAVHLDNGWPAIAPSNPPAICIPETDAHARSNPLERYIKCLNVNERTIEASKRLARARTILRGTWKLQLPERLGQHRQAEQRHRVRRHLSGHVAGPGGDRRRPLSEPGLLSGPVPAPEPTATAGMSRLLPISL